MKIWKKATICWFLTIFYSLTAHTQERVTTVGIQLKPIIPYKLLNTGERSVQGEDVNFNIQPKLGYSFGMVIRVGISNAISLETGLNYVARNYSLNVQKDQLELGTKMVFDGYEAPLLALVFIKLGRQLYMNSALGASFDFYPTGGIVSNQEGYEFGIVESNWAQTSLLANLGFEYRTDKSGYIYFGASFHRPFTKTADVILSEQILSSNAFNRLIESELSGNYLTLDLRYFFHERPRAKK